MPSSLQSIDLRLGDEFARVYSIGGVIKPWDIGTYWSQKFTTENEFEVLTNGAFILGVTLEHVSVPDYLVARIEGRSSLARLGLIVHTTAGYVDPGWDGRLTLELVNLNEEPIALKAGMSIAQLSVERLESPAERPYGSPGLGSKYRGEGIEGSLYGAG